MKLVPFSLSIVIMAPLCLGLLWAENNDSRKLKFEQAITYFKKNYFTKNIEGIRYSGSLKSPTHEQKGELEFGLDLVIESKGEAHVLKNCRLTDKLNCGWLALTCLGGSGHYTQTLENWSKDHSNSFIYTYDQGKANKCHGIGPTTSL